MGFFDSLAKSLVNSVSKSFENAASDKYLNNVSTTSNTPNVTHNTLRANKTTMENYSTYQASGVIKEAFPEYQIMSNINPEQFGWTVSTKYKNQKRKAYCRNLDIVLTLNGAPVAVVMWTPHGRGASSDFKNAMQTAYDYNVPFVNFFDFMRNDKDYVIERICNSIR